MGPWGTCKSKLNFCPFLFLPIAAHFCPLLPISIFISGQGWLGQPPRLHHPTRNRKEGKPDLNFVVLFCILILADFTAFSALVGVSEVFITFTFAPFAPFRLASFSALVGVSEVFMTFTFAPFAPFRLASFSFSALDGV
jgi:hypothetical protein